MPRTSRKAAAIGAAASFLLTLSPAMTASAADIKVLTTSNMMGMLEGVAPAFESASGYKLKIEHGGAAPVKNKLAAGEVVDVAIHSRWALDELAKLGKVRGVVDIARIPVGLALRAGAPRPAIDSVEALKRVLLAAASVANPDPAGGSLGGIYFAGLLEQLGIAEQMKPKVKLTGPATAAAELVAKGGAEMVVDQLVQLRAVPGLDLVPLPAALKAEIVMAAALPATVRDADAAVALVKFLASPAAAPAIRAKGMEP